MHDCFDSFYVNAFVTARRRIWFSGIQHHNKTHAEYGARLVQAITFGLVRRAYLVHVWPKPLSMSEAAKAELLRYAMERPNYSCRCSNLTTGYGHRMPEEHPWARM